MHPSLSKTILKFFFQYSLVDLIQDRVLGNESYNKKVMKGTESNIRFGGIFIMLLVGLHIAVVALQYKIINKDPAGVIRDFQIKMFNQQGVFIIIASGLTFFISLFLLTNIFKTSKMRIILTTANLVFEFAIAVLISINISTMSISRQFNIDNFGVDPLDGNSDYKTMYYLYMADAAITFAFEVVFLAFFYYSTLRNALPDEKQMDQNYSQRTPLNS